MRHTHLLRSRLGAFVLGLALVLPASDHAMARPYIEPDTQPHTLQRRQSAATNPPPTREIARRWASDDGPIAAGEAQRSWTWGPQIFRSSTELYANAPGGSRPVWYLDKARMEITNPQADADSDWFVTSGLLARELISGQMQTGDATYETRPPAAVPVAGDLEAPRDQTITYVDLLPLASLDNDKRVPSRLVDDPIVVEQIGTGGVVRQDERYLSYAVHLRSYDDVIGHHIPDVFADALPADQLLYIAGRPLTEPYWATVPINHQPQDVLIQAFERRVLTYTPSNPPAWHVEWGNVGRQYAQWRYGVAADGPALDPAVVPDPTLTERPLAELAPAAVSAAQGRQGTIGVALLDLRTNMLYTRDGSERFPMYSTAKVPIMLGVLDRVQREKRAVADWEDQLMRIMIQQSNNDAATQLISSIGGADRLTHYLRSIGLLDTTMNAYGWGDSTTTPQDMARLMGKLGDCTILTPKLCAYALDLMRGVVPDQRWGVSAGLPSSATIAIKNGWSPDENGWAINSVGFVSGAGKRYALAIYTRPNPTMQYGIDSIERVAREVNGAVP